MDIPCLKCGEPWDASDFYDMKHDPEFSISGSHIEKCPACASHSEPIRSREDLATISDLADICGDDSDGLAGMLDDFGLA